MSYQVLARKWRPKTFAELAGQEHVVTALTNALTRGRLHHAYLLTGTRGVGKTTIARILAKSLNCATGVTATPCGVCASCIDIDARRADAAWRCGNPGRAVEAFSEDPRDRRLADAARPRQQIRVMQPPARERVGERGNDVLLACELGERLRPPLAGEYLVAHGREA